MVEVKPLVAAKGILGDADYSSSEDSDDTESTSSSSDSDTTDTSDESEDESAVKEAIPAVEESVKRVCKYFAKNGRCRNGDKCDFAHVVCLLSRDPADDRNHKQCPNRMLPRENKRSSLVYRSTRESTLSRGLVCSER